MADFSLPRQPNIGEPLDVEFFNSYYTSILQMSKVLPEFWIDASNNDDNNDAKELGNARIRVVAGRYKVKGKKTGSGIFSWTIKLPNGFTKRGSGKADLFDPIIIVTPESKDSKVDDPVALMVQDVDEDQFTVIVKEVATGKKGDGKALNIDYINYIAIGFV